MVKLGYHVSHEQFSPSELLDLVMMAEEAGFQFAVSSDHYNPWNESQGHSGYAWSWLGAALAKTSIPMGVVNCPCHRYHPAIIAQAVATLLEMFPGRFWIAVGSGQLLNEGVIGAQWPSKPFRNDKLREAVKVMRALWRGEEINHQGLFEVQEAKLYTLPKALPHLVGAAITPETAEWLGEWADGLITVSQPMDQLQKVTEAWRRSEGKNKPMVLKWQVSYDQEEEKALQGAYEQWKTNIFESGLSAQLRTPKQFEQASTHIKPEAMSEHVFISNDPAAFISKINEFHQMGFEKIDVHNVNKGQKGFIDFFGKHVLPAF
ncbi:MAG: TIGR03885 family FMN-dependent LLM class oxidoreductase [Anditalea sp.]